MCVTLFGNIIDKLRIERNLSIEELAFDLNLSYKSMFNIISGKSFPRYDTILKICNYFERDFFDLHLMSEDNPISIFKSLDNYIYNNDFDSMEKTLNQIDYKSFKNLIIDQNKIEYILEFYKVLIYGVSSKDYINACGQIIHNLSYFSNINENNFNSLTHISNIDCRNFMHLSNLYALMGNKEKAIEVLKLLEEKSCPNIENKVKVQLNLGKYLFYNENFKDSIEYLDKTICFAKNNMLM